MANVNLPNTDGMTTMDELRNAVGKMTKELSWLLNNLDTRNVNELNAEVIIANTITADKMNVNELSAITANLGHITAGLIESIRIFGSYIATRNGAFPRAELNNVGDLIAVYTNANNYLTIEPGITDEPVITYRNGGSPSLVIGPAFGFSVVLSTSDILMGTNNGSLQLQCGSGPFDNITVPNWDRLVNPMTGLSLQDELDSLRAELAGKADISHSHTVNLGTHNHGIAGAVNWGGTFSVS
ncbi:MULTISPECIES: hypothetical protein [Paenibacillus]|uniref:Uncharacterized protein n=1 Tax=Paenibacillus odorifer TaxID=189426 RepID=A0ABX3HXD8_9BACL|nr:hypothetical protein [Paenibacillus odorifer]OMD55257.1 hypothetical protein BSK51_04180 [Paenibacillus odorifer]